MVDIILTKLKLCSKEGSLFWNVEFRIMCVTRNNYCILKIFSQNQYYFKNNFKLNYKLFLHYFYIRSLLSESEYLYPVPIHQPYHQ
jgi:hypothetical protein